ncbi:hypothetical protein TW80_05180 [Loktanella sp. S4079]|nr:hypothetical protein TW80_05180 [Loktanella sp. S4079]
MSAFALCVLAACDQTPPIVVEDNLPVDDPRQQALVMSECAIYYAAVTKSAEAGQALSGNPTKDCPIEARARAADINPMVSVPPVTPGYPETLYQRMIARGVPVAMADDIAKSKAFWDLVAQRDSAYADF